MKMKWMKYADAQLILDAGGFSAIAAGYTGTSWIFAAPVVGSANEVAGNLHASTHKKLNAKHGVRMFAIPPAYLETMRASNWPFVSAKQIYMTPTSFAKAMLLLPSTPQK